MVATKTGYAYISACRQDGSEILTAISLFLGSSYTMRSTGMFYDQTGSEKFNMAACKQEGHISQLVDVIETKKSNGYIYVFRVAILDFPLPVWSYNIPVDLIG